MLFSLVEEEGRTRNDNLLSSPVPVEEVHQLDQVLSRVPGFHRNNNGKEHPTSYDTAL